MKKRNFSDEDINIGDVIRFYDNGWRDDVVTKIQNRRKGRCKLIHTSRYGKVPFDDVSEIYIYDNKRTVIKPLMDDFFI